MKARFRHFGTAVRSKPAYRPAATAEPLALAGRACCCPARPVVTVLMPPTPDRPRPVDLLLCGHHYRASRAAIAAAGAAVYDELGMPIMITEDDHETARLPAAAAPRG